MKINFVLTGEGPSDLRLVDHIENVLIDEGFAEVSGDAPDLSIFNPPVGRTVRDKLVALLRHYPNADAIFVHRDADNAGDVARQLEIEEAADGLIPLERVIPIVPVAMLETWLLADPSVIKRVAGNERLKGPINCLPPVAQLEQTTDTKRVLLDALCEASQTQGGRLKSFKARYPEMRARLTFDLDPNGPVQRLPSYRRFREQIRAFARNRLGA